MPDLFDLDRAFEALAHDVMDRTAPPSAFAAIKQARRRRRTAIATVALAAAVVVGGVAVPTLLDEGPGIGFADGLPDAAPLNSEALDDATEGWITDWREGTSGAYTAPSCSFFPEGPETPVGSGRSTFIGSGGSGIRAVFQTYSDSSATDRAWGAHIGPLEGCGEAAETETRDYPDGTSVRHFTMSADPGDGAAHATMTDVWVARTGTTIGSAYLTTSVGAAEDDAIDGVGEALVAGLLDGWTEVQEDSQTTPDAKLRPQLPYADERILTSALAGWRNAAKVDAEELPATPCLKAFASGTSGNTSSEPSGAFLTEEGYAKPGPEARRQVQAAVESLRGCDVAMAESSLPGGVTLFTYDRGGDAGHGAVWLANNDDRAIVVALDGAASPLPTGVGPAVGTFMTGALDLPWPEAS